MVVKQAVKRGALAVAAVLTAPLSLLARLERAALGSEHLFVAGGQVLALLPGRLGSFLRLGYYRFTLSACSADVVIGFGSYFSQSRARLGRRVSIGAYCVLGMADIDDDVMVASRVSIPSGKRQHLDENGQIVQRGRFETVQIGTGCWIGEGAIVMAPLGPGCIVSAGAVVLKEVPARCLVGGNPARLVRELEAAPVSA